MLITIFSTSSFPRACIFLQRFYSFVIFWKLSIARLSNPYTVTEQGGGALKVQKLFCSE